MTVARGRGSLIIALALAAALVLLPLCQCARRPPHAGSASTKPPSGSTLSLEALPPSHEKEKAEPIPAAAPPTPPSSMTEQPVSPDRKTMARPSRPFRAARRNGEHELRRDTLERTAPKIVAKATGKAARTPSSGLAGVGTGGAAGRSTSPDAVMARRATGERRMALAARPSPPPPSAARANGHSGAKDNSASAPSPPEPDAFAMVDRILDRLKSANIAFNTPTSINLRETALIELILSLDKPMAELKEMIAAEGERAGARIKVASRMEARLSGPDFQIAAITPETQAITARNETRWKWEVKPLSTGRHRLHLTMTALITVEGSPTPRPIRTFDKVIEVNVSWSQRFSGFLRDNWQWLWATAIIPLAGWLWKKRKKPRPDQ